VFFTIEGFEQKKSPLGWLASDGMDVTWDPGIDAHFPFFLAIKQMSVGNSRVRRKQHYRVALTDGLLRAMFVAKHMFHIPFDLSRLEDTGIEAWQAIHHAVQRRGQLHLEEFRVGLHVHTQAADLAVFPYGIHWASGAKGALEVEVENLGLTSSQPATLECQAGLRDDVIAYNTDGQIWSPVGEIQIPSILYLQKARFSLPWPLKAADAGRWPVKCQVKTRGDRYHKNDSAQTVLQILP